MTKKRIFIGSTIIVSLLTPFVAFGASASFVGTGLIDLLNDFGGVVDIFFPIMLGLALVFFFWGVAQFVLHAGDPKLRTDGRNKMIWGIVAIFVFVSIFGIIQFIGSAFNLAPTTTVK